MFTTTIRHIVVVPNDVSDENCTFFQRYSDEIVSSYQWVFDVLSGVPHDAMEPFLSSPNYVKSKLAGSSLDVQMIRSDLLKIVYDESDWVFNIIWSTPETFSQAKESEMLFKYKPLHVTSCETKEALFIGELTPESLNEEINNYIRQTLSSLDSSDATDEVLAIISSGQKKDAIKLGFSPLNHNCTRALYKPLTGYGYYAEDFEDIIPSDNIDQHVRGMTNLSEVINDIRENVEIPYHLIKNDSIIYSMAMCSFLYKHNSQMWNELYRKLDKPKRDFLKLAIIRNKLFSNFTVSTPEVFNPYEDPIISGLLKERQSELAMFTSVVTILAVNQFAPALRLPNAVMLHHDLLKNISSLITNPNKKSHRSLNIKLKNYSDTLKSEIGDDLINASIIGKNKLLTMCDFPIEWLNVDGFPIMFTHEVSRIPTTPGNLCSQLALSGQRVIVPYEAFRDILIISSFNSADPIKDHLTSSLDQFKAKNQYKNLNITEVNVSSESELIDALNDFSGGIVVFDCHGNHGGETEHGWLCIGDDKVDVWSLAHKTRIPPIVVLSACSTHPIDGSHASVANGFFRCGAISVIGTFAPIRADHAGLFVARLLFRISVFIPIIIKSRTITWREVIAGFLRMSYSTDVLQYMAGELNVLTKQQYIDIHNETNYIINSGEKNWTKKFIATISEKTGKDESEIIGLINENCQFVDTMLYSQLGRPENIVICQ
ncbi:CHAT domain-containing protein [Photobacterium halotolerans]|uniref:CHAT domain-containing protein n=1 Tax=Photobacterium halotolerans TaxID=265726 RepID=UPI000486D543|nr:CHAT domain-containing protein [Photobacterium halotolerans]